MLMKLTGNNH